MSETTEPPAPETTEIAQPAAETAPETQNTEASPNTEAASAPDTEPTPPPKKPSQGDRRFAVMSAKLAAAEREARKFQEERDAALALANVGKEPTTQPAPRAESVEAAAERLLAQRQVETRRQALIAEGSRELGAEGWQEKTDVLHGLGATQNEAFMEALVSLPPSTAAKLVASLADDADGLIDLLGKSKYAIATEVGRMAAEISKPAPAPKLSNAPRPPATVQPAAVIKEPDIYDETLSMAEWSKAWDKRQKARREERMGR